MIICGATFIENGYRVAVAKPGRKWMQVVFMDGSNIRVRRVASDQQFKPIPEYSLKKLARRFLRPRSSLGIKKNISKRARAILREALQ